MPIANPILQRWCSLLCVVVLSSTWLAACSASSASTTQYSNSSPQSGSTAGAGDLSPITTTQQESPLATNEPQPISSPLPEATTSPADAPRTRYQITATLDYRLHHLSAEEQIEYVNTSDVEIADFVLIVEPLRYPAVFRLNSLTWEDGTAIENASWEVNRLRFPLPQPLQPGERLVLHLAYELDLPSPDPAFYGRPVPFGYTARQTNLVDWYPFIPPYLAGQGWLVHEPWFYGEHLVYETSDFQVNLRLAGATQNAPTGEEQALTVAASAPAEKDGEWYRYYLQAARNFAFSISDMYQVLTTTVGDVTILGYAFPFHARAGEAALKTTADSLALFTQLYGPYPHTTLSVVEADFLDGMEFDGLYFLSNGFYNLYSGSPGEYLVAIAAHETSHQWFYGLVGNDQALEPWLDEALATYNERIFYENLFPQALEWWLEYRIRYYQPRGWVDGTIYNPEGYRAYRDAVYLNGALFLEDLRHRIGDQTFFTFLHDYVQRYSHRQATTGDFFKLLQSHTAVTYKDLLQKYFKNPITP